MEELFSIRVSDNADDEIWHNEAVNKKLTKYEKWFSKTKQVKLWINHIFPVLLIISLILFLVNV